MSPETILDALEIPPEAHKRKSLMEFEFFIISCFSNLYVRERTFLFSEVDEIIALIESSTKVVVIVGDRALPCSDRNLYKKLKDRFDIERFYRSPDKFYRFLCDRTFEETGESYTTNFLKKINSQNKLLRVYMEGIQGNEFGFGPERVIHCNGTLSSASCTLCNRKFDGYVLMEYSRSVDSAPVCGVCDSLIKPDIYLLRERVDDSISSTLIDDLSTCDLLLVFGSSLSSFPLNNILSIIPPRIPSINIDEKSSNLPFDLRIVGEVPSILRELEL
jgi:NAD-dependent SIR2 family protein deacetylase